jgi:hypothetical protein
MIAESELERQSHTKGWASLGGVLAALGGLAGVVGVFLPWALARVTFRGGNPFAELAPELEGLPSFSLPAFVGRAETVTAPGTSDLAGQVAALLGLAAVVVAVFMILAPSTLRRRWGIGLAVLGSLITLLVVMGFVGVERIARAEFIGAAKEQAESLLAAAGPLGSILSEPLNQVIDALGDLFQLDARLGVGLYVSGAGGILASVGGLLALVDPGGRGLRGALADWEAGDRAELHRVLSGSPEARAASIEELRASPDRRWMADLLVDLEKDHKARGQILEVLDALDRGR